MKDEIYWFTATWCMPCKQLVPLVESSTKTIIKLDISEHKDLAKRYGIRSIPAMVYKDEVHVGLPACFKLVKG